MMMEISENCVYAVLQGEKLKDAINNTKSFTFTENKPWATALELHKKAKEQGEEMPVLFADARYGSQLLYWGFLQEIAISEKTTSCKIKRLYALKGEHTCHELTKKSGGTISEDYQRSYIPCFTPEFFITENKETIENHQASLS